MSDSTQPSTARDQTVGDTVATPGQRSPLHARHLDLGATMGPFGGWDMPISYADGGVVAEHTAVRESVGVFDVSHLGKVAVRGEGAAEFINRCFTADLAKIAPGQAQYTMCCTDSGGVIDDLIVYLIGYDDILLVPNAANTAAVVQALLAVVPDGIDIVDQHHDYGVIAVQGPESAAVLSELGIPTDLGYMSWEDAQFQGQQLRVCRSGYTGEQGYELLPTWDAAPALWDALMAAASARGGRAAGLGARDTLRTEMGYPLHGQDLSRDISPLQAGARWAVGWKKDAFFGREALLAEKEAGPKRRLRGLDALGKGVLRPQLPVVRHSSDGDVQVGVTTSGTFSPTLSRAIALALIDTDADVAEGDELEVQVRKRTIAVRVTKPPFVESHVR